MITIFIGPPGSGKGTQAKLLSKKYGIKHFCMGDLIREEKRKGTKLGKLFASYIDKGNLVPDEHLLNFFEEKFLAVTEKNIIIDGFPRTLKQAELVDSLLEKNRNSIDNVVYFQIELPFLIGRLSGRRSCGNCGEVYHTISRPVPKNGSCTACGSSEIFQRADDTPEVIKQRFSQYSKSTEPLLEFYESQKKLSTFGAIIPVNEMQDLLSWYFENRILQ